MKEEKLLDAIGLVGDDLVEKAKATNHKLKKKRKIKKILYSSVAAVLAVILYVTAIHTGKKSSIELYANIIYETEYPEALRDDARWSFEREYEAANIDKTEFLKKTIGEFMDEAGEENMIYSPLSAYMALGMLAETTDGNSRRQLLELLGNESVEELRKEAEFIWKLNYIDEDITKSKLASSMWLEKGVDFNKDTLKNISEKYYASSYRVSMESEDFTKAIGEWINGQTGNMLEEQTDSIEAAPNTFLVLMNTLYFEADWSEEFKEEDTKAGVFKGTAGEEKCDFMYQRDAMTYYVGDNFTAVDHWFKDAGGWMTYILPNEGVTTSQLFNDMQAVEFMADKYSLWDDRKSVYVNLTVPKFDVESQIDLQQGLKELGVTDVFDFDKSDFSKLTDEGEAAVGSILQGARVGIDEKGCIAATHTEVDVNLRGGSTAEEEIDFVLDRPFIFVLCSNSGMPLFVGVVNQMD